MRKQAPDNIVEIYLSDFNNRKTDNPTAWALANGWSSAQILKRRAKELGITLPKRSTCKLDSKVNWELEKDFVDAHLLGDGSLVDPKNNKVSVIQTCCKYKEYLEWLITLSPIWDGTKVWSVEVFDKRTNNTYERYWIRSKSSHFLQSHKEKWYVNGKKSLPEDFSLTKRGLLILFIEDGSYRSSGITISLHDFTKDEIERIQDKFYQLTNLSTTIHYEYGQAVKLYIGKRDIPTFFEYIGACPVECYSYKWPLVLPLSKAI